MCRAASGATVKGAQQMGLQVSAIVGAGWLVGGRLLPQGWWGGGRCDGTELSHQSSGRAEIQDFQR